MIARLLRRWRIRRRLAHLKGGDGSRLDALIEALQTALQATERALVVAEGLKRQRLT